MPDLFSGYCAVTNLNNPPSCGAQQFANDGSHPGAGGREFIAEVLAKAMNDAGFFLNLPAADDAGYFVLEQDGELYAFGQARAVLRSLTRGDRERGPPGHHLQPAEGCAGRCPGGGRRDHHRPSGPLGAAERRAHPEQDALALPGVPASVLVKTVAGQPERATVGGRLERRPLGVHVGGEDRAPDRGASRRRWRPR